MFTVSIIINGNPVMTRSAVNTGKEKKGKIIYKSDDGLEVLHDPEDGAVTLAKKLLDTIKENDWDGSENRSNQETDGNKARTNIFG